ncbi:MAG TPA: transposase [Candidatus Diapherotrites archaeon]|jgi:large subunit ribosomal protein L37Ae|nr:transposase [Candidatus Diapherotrites archaeon]
MSTKKVGKTGKYGVRGGVGIRKKYLLAIEDKTKKVCPKCGTKDKLKRVATGIYQCQKCKAKVSGGAYKFKTTTK